MKKRKRNKRNVKIHSPFVAIICPKCGSQELFDPGAHDEAERYASWDGEGEYEYIASSGVWLVCRACKSVFDPINFSRRYWLKPRNYVEYKHFAGTSPSSKHIELKCIDREQRDDDVPCEPLSESEATRHAHLEGLLRGNKNDIRQAKQLLVQQTWAPLKLKYWLRAAVYYKREDLVTLLIEQGASLKGVLGWAMEHQQFDLAIRLLHAGANPNEEVEKIYSIGIEQINPLPQREYTYTFFTSSSPIRNSLELAIIHHQFELVKTLLERGASPQNTYSLLLAIEHGQSDMLRMLLEQGGSPQNTSPFRLAIKHVQPEMLRMLLEYKQEVNINDQRYGDAYSPLHQAIEARAQRGGAMNTADSDEFRMIRMLLEHGADPNLWTASPKSGPGWHPLQHAQEMEDHALISLLEQYGAELNETEPPEFKVGDAVKVKPWVRDPDELSFYVGEWRGRHIGGCQGRIRDMTENADDTVSIEIEWDSLTLRQMPAHVFENREESGVEWRTIFLSPDELEPAEPRDTEDDVQRAQDAIAQRLREMDNEDDYWEDW